MARSHDNSLRLKGQCRFPVFFINGSHGDDTVLSPFNVRDSRLKMILSAMLNHTLADIGNKTRKFVRTDVRMSVNENGRISTEVHELMENLPIVPSLRGSRKELAIRESTGSALTVAIIGIRIHDSCPGQLRDIRLTAAYILAALQNHRLEAEGKELQCCKHTCRTGSDDNHRLTGMNILIFRKFILLIRFIFPVSLHSVTHSYVTSGIYRTMHDMAMRIGIVHRRLI